MGKITTDATMSIDGYLAGPGDSGFDLLFHWNGNGDVETPTGNPTTPSVRPPPARRTLPSFTSPPARCWWAGTCTT